MNVLFVAEYYFANPDFVQLSKQLARRKHNISIATSLRTADKKMEEENVQIFEMKPFVTIYKVPHTLSFPLSRLCQIVKKQSINVIHALNDYSTNVATAALVARATQKPFVYTIQGLGTRTGHLLVDSLAHLYDLTAERWVAKEARRVILLSKGLISRADKLRIERSKIVVIPSGVDVTHFNLERPEVKNKAFQIKDKFNIGNEIIIGYAGRLVPAKGLPYLFFAMEKIQERHPNIALLIVGDGVQRNELEAMARDLKIRTIFAGWQRDIVPYYFLMDIFVLPSFFEGLPNVMLEAMAMEKPVVATDVGGTSDLVRDGENGFLVPHGDVESLASAIKKLVLDTDLRSTMGRIGRNMMKRDFSWETILTKIEGVYKEALH